MKYLIAEHCDADIYTGWHLYLRDSPEAGQRNGNGGWGWIRRLDGPTNIGRVLLRQVGIEIRGDGTCDDQGLQGFAERFATGEIIGGKPRGCLPVVDGKLALGAVPAGIGAMKMRWILDEQVRRGELLLWIAAAVVASLLL